MSNPNRPASRPAGATPAGGEPRRRKWVLPLIIGLIVLIALLLLLTRCGNDNKSDSPPGTSTSTATAAPTDTTSTATTTPSPSTSSSGQPGGDTSAPGTVTANGDDLLSAPTNISKGGHDGEQAVGHGVLVQSVPADEGFWVGTGTTNRLWVQLSGTHGESDYQVKKGDAVNFTGVVKAAGDTFAAGVGLTGSEGADQLTQQGHYISVPSSSIKLFH